MKVYVLPEPSRVLTHHVFVAKAKWPWLRWPLAFFLVMVWALLIPPAWAVIKLGDLGHRVAGWCGLDSREW
jgi:hypothetical protein